jgi:hypothetical protein
MQNKTPPKGEVSRGPLPSISPANLSLSTAALQTHFLASRYTLTLETAALVAALAFGGHHHG